MQKYDAPSYSPGLEGVIAGESAICQVDEGEAGLRYRGYAVSELAEYSSFEEVTYLLLHGTLPTRKELEDFGNDLRCQRRVPGFLEAALEMLSPEAHPMDILRSAVSLLGLTDRETGDGSPACAMHLSACEHAQAGADRHDVNVRKAVRLLAQIPAIVARAYHVTQGKRPASPDPRASVAEYLLLVLTHRKGDELAHEMAHVLDVSLILYAEHELNASTFAARVAASTLTDLHSAVTAAIATLKGPLHGGANEAVAAMLVEIGSPDRAEAWVREALAQKRGVMGFGHRVLKKGDARSAIIKRHAERLSHLCGDTRWFDIASIVDRTMRDEKGLYPNLDFYTAVTYLLIGIPRGWSTPVFVCSRMAGWCAHVIEQQDHNRLIRPRALYTGPPPKPYVPIDQRS